MECRIWVGSQSAKLAAETSICQPCAFNPETPDAHTLLANVNLSQDAVDQAEADFRAAIAANLPITVHYQTQGCQPFLHVADAAAAMLKM